MYIELHVMNHVGAEAFTSGRMISSGTISTPAEVTTEWYYLLA